MITQKWCNMKISVGTKIAATTARYTLPFTLPTKKYFSEMHISTIWSVTYTQALYIRLLEYQTATKYTILWEGWARPSSSQDSPIRIPINYLIEEDSFSKFEITADYVCNAGAPTSDLKIDIIYQDYIYNATSNYDHLDHKGYAKWKIFLDGNASVGNQKLTITIPSGEHIIIRHLSLEIETAGITNQTLYYQIGNQREHSVQASTGDVLYMNPRYFDSQLDGQTIVVGCNTLDASERVIIRLQGYVRTHTNITYVFSGSGSYTENQRSII